MIHTDKKTISFSIILVLTLSFILLTVTGEIIAPATADAAAASDNITTGTMDGYSNDYIIVNNARYGFCRGIKIFNKKGKELPLRDMDAALEVQLYESTGCVNKIVVLSFAH